MEEPMEVGQSYASESPNTPQEDAPVNPPKNFVARLIGTWFSPGETFAEMKWAPKLLLPILFSIVFGAVSGFAMSQRLDFQRMMRENFEQVVADGKMKAEDADAQAQTWAKFGSVQFVVIGAIGGLISALIIAGLFKLISMMMGHENTFGSLFAVTLYTFIAVSIVSTAVFLTLLYLKDPSEITFKNMGNIVSSNVGSWIALVAGENALPRFLMALLARIDLFSIWMIALLSIGYAAVTRRMKTSTAATYLVALYVVYALGASAIAAVTGQ
jgi:Yip1 domain